MLALNERREPQRSWAPQRLPDKETDEFFRGARNLGLFLAICAIGGGGMAALIWWVIFHG